MFAASAWFVVGTGALRFCNIGISILGCLLSSVTDVLVGSQHGATELPICDQV